MAASGTAAPISTRVGKHGSRDKSGHLEEFGGLPRVTFSKHKRVSSKCFACSHLSRMDTALKGTPGARAQRKLVEEHKRLHARFFVAERTHWHH